MGIDRFGAEFALFAHATNVDFGRTVTIGRQRWMLSRDELCGVAARFASKFDRVTARPVVAPDIEAVTVSKKGFAEGLFRALGASTVDSIDMSSFEGASIEHDMNDPLPEPLLEQFSVVMDGGALEHIFNFPQAIENCMRLVAQGGHFLAIVPLNDQVGHGFYQFSPELYFRTFCGENGFTVEHLLMRAHGPRAGWTRLTDPADLGWRPQFSTFGAADMYVVARRTGTPGLARVPQQSDYESMWTASASGEGEDARTPRRSSRRQLMKRRAYAAGGRLSVQLRDYRNALGKMPASAGFERVRLPELAGADQQARTRT